MRMLANEKRYAPRNRFNNKILTDPTYTKRTFASCRPFVNPTRWTLATFSAAKGVSTLSFAVASAVVFLALVHVYTYVST